MSSQFHLNKFNPIWTSYSALPTSLLIMHDFFVCLLHNLHTFELHMESYRTNLVKISYWTQTGEISRWLVWVINSRFIVEKIVKSSPILTKFSAWYFRGVIQGRFHSGSRHWAARFRCLNSMKLKIKPKKKKKITENI